ncbi:T-cell activation Rho GTPase-activating protein isoform X2 [Pipistrellus kuhlii]|uniref:T-cell activation Rho GTPase-activating protein n=2 Tax=Pipistrellus kuhlii TaxID=59472 RepID=A0A7J7YPM9_PIPKU|nr:T-cell activation Rho GTPase-activating protein isoform X2 [Pipistrellus kuhlii]KAF6363758.1 T cell activation RhoGTPase activating protein [Pipistrellus kuhlii]
MKLTSSCHAPKTLNVNNMETFIECQSEGDIKQHPLLASCESEDSICQLIEIKKRKKVLSWPFLMRRLSPPSDFSGASEPELKASLFDQPLSIICGDDDTLPRPIQDILTILCLKGPSTEGIFRKAANEKARKELKEELNSGVMVDLKSLPVHLLAVVFKDFLRSIPRKLLSCDLFEDWMGALERQNEEDRIEALRQVAEKLPRPNLLLLKHLLSVLYLVSKNAEVSKMDASNLAICVGPNMLTRESDRDLSLEAQKDLNNQVKTLVEFLIDNCLEIFGENIPVHSSSVSDDSLEHTDGSDTSTLQNDSAYDSTDPDGDCGSALGSPAGLPPGPWDTAAPVEPVASTVASTVARLKRALGDPDRRHSEPGVSPSPECPGSRQANPKLTRSEDAPGARPASSSGSEEAEDPFPEEVFPAVEGGSQRPQDLQDLRVQSSTRGAVSLQGRAPTACSSGSLDASSDSSPPASPSSPRRNFFSRHQSFTKTDKSKPSREIKKHSMSFSFASHKRALPRPPSLSLRARGPGRKDFRRESQLAGRIVQENLSEPHGQAALDFSPGSCAPSGEDMFRLVDRTRPGSPPSYEEAVRGPRLALAARGSQTVGSLRARMLSLDSGLAPRLPVHHGADLGSTCGQEPLDEHRLSPRTASWSQSRTGCAGETVGPGTVIGRPELHRLRTVSESPQRGPWDCLAGRCSHSQPAFEADQLLYAKESYI